MTDPELVHRAEQAYLGALLARHGRSGTGAVVAGDSGLSAVLTPQDFADPVHRSIFTAVTSQAGPQQTGITAWYERSRELLNRLLSPRARATAAYLAELSGLCPDPANLPAYAAMVTDASGDRADQARAQRAKQSASEDPTLASAGTWLDGARTNAHPAGGRRLTSWLDGVAADLAPDAARRARALRADARQATNQDPGNAPVKREDLEDRVLASLMTHPAEGRAVTTWLSAEAFSTAPLRDLYDLIRQRLASGRPVDPLIIAWDASRLPDFDYMKEYGGAAFLTQVARQVGGLDPAPGTAEVLGRALWADRILAMTQGGDWATRPDSLDLLITLRPDYPGDLPGPGERIPAAMPVVTEATAVAAVATAGAAVADRQQPVTQHHPVPALPVPAQPAPFQPVPLPLQQPPAPAPDGPAQRM